MGSSALPLMLCEYFIIFYSILYALQFCFSVLFQYSAEDKRMVVLCVGGSQCLLYSLMFRFNVMICYVWIRYRVSENMHLSVLHVKDGGPVDILVFFFVCFFVILVLPL